MWAFRQTCNNCSQEATLRVEKQKNKKYGDIMYPRCDYGNYPDLVMGDPGADKAGGGKSPFSGNMGIFFVGSIPGIGQSPRLGKTSEPEMSKLQREEMHFITGVGTKKKTQKPGRVADPA